MTLCPTCHESIPSDDINVAADVAHCRACGSTTALSAIVAGKAAAGAAEEREPGVPLVQPTGTWFVDDGVEIRLGATLRSPIAFFLVPFMCVWSGGSLGGIYGSQIMRGQFDLGQSLFGIPFILGTILFGTITLLSVIGKIEIRMRGDEGQVFTGIGPIGWTRRFRLSEFSKVTEVQHAGSRSSNAFLTLEGLRRMSFGWGLKSERRYYVMETLRQILNQRTTRRPGSV
jgi:hypothetical protein